MPKSPLVLAAPLLMAVLFLGGCSGGADAPASTASPDPAVEAVSKTRDFAKCMREAGVDMPDPDADGAVVVPPAPKGADEEQAKMQAASEKCSPLLPNGGKPEKPTAEELARMKALAQCLRKNGLPNWPDPDPNIGEVPLKETGYTAEEANKALENCESLNK
ncbi:hypothetical protein [Actinoplanes sp. NPDC049265]|uniref:hypothetical protein n=1 Tax=Actinoplanes sp. NPDC049265 TaxID=3363902 RepID=UPI00371C2F3E